MLRGSVLSLQYLMLLLLLRHWSGHCAGWNCKRV